MRILFCLLLIISSCSHFQSSPKIDESKISIEVKQKLDEARELIKQNKPKIAISKLAELDDNKISPIEKSLKYNLKGVTLFNMG